jgi:hypothetical protein
MADQKVIAIARARGAKAERELQGRRIGDLEDMMRVLADTNEKIVDVMDALRETCAAIHVKLDRIEAKLEER